MQLANIAVLAHKKALRTHRQRFPARYERLFERHGKIWRYYSAEPAVLYGEWIYSLVKQGDPIGRLVYVHKINEHTWYMAALNEQGVEQETIGDINYLLNLYDYPLHHAEKIWVTHEDFYLTREHNSRCVDKSNLDDATLASFELDRKQASPFKLIGLGVGALLSALMVMQLWFDASEPVVVTKVRTAPEQTAKALYLARYAQKRSASDALQSARNLLLETQSMPLGMEVNMASVSDGVLTAQVSQSSDAKTSLARAWLQRHPNIQQHLQGTQLRINLPALAPWQAQSVRGYHALLTEGVERLGGTFTISNTQHIDDVTITTMDIRLDGAIGKLSVLAELLDAPFVALNTLHLELDERYTMPRLDVSVDVQGESYVQ